MTVKGAGIGPLSEFLHKSVNGQETLIRLMCHPNQPLCTSDGTPSTDPTAQHVHGAGDHLVHCWHVPAHQGLESHGCSDGLQPWCILHQLGPRLSWLCRSDILWLTEFSLPSFGFHQDPAVVPDSGQDFSSESHRQAAFS